MICRAIDNYRRHVAVVVIKSGHLQHSINFIGRYFMRISVSIFITCLVALLLHGCSAGDLRAFSDAASKQSGHEVTYPDQSHTDYCGDVKMITGVKNGKGFLKLINTDDNYCKVKITFESERLDYYHLSPRENTGKRYMGIYNQVDAINTLCGETESVFNEPL